MDKAVKPDFLADGKEFERIVQAPFLLDMGGQMVLSFQVTLAICLELGDTGQYEKSLSVSHLSDQETNGTA